jgi:hypothetical protein
MIVPDPNVLRDLSLFMAGVAPKKNVFLGKNFAVSAINKSKNFLPNFKYQLENKHPPLAKNVTNGKLVPHVLYCFCDMNLITACAIFCSLKSHVDVVCTCTFFGDISYLLTNRKMFKIV